MRSLDWRVRFIFMKKWCLDYIPIVGVWRGEWELLLRILGLTTHTICFLKKTYYIYFLNRQFRKDLLDWCIREMKLYQSCWFSSDNTYFVYSTMVNVSLSRDVHYILIHESLFLDSHVSGRMRRMIKYDKDTCYLEEFYTQME